MGDERGVTECVGPNLKLYSSRATFHMWMYTPHFMCAPDSVSQSYLMPQK